MMPRREPNGTASKGLLLTWLAGWSKSHNPGLLTMISRASGAGRPFDIVLERRSASVHHELRWRKHPKKVNCEMAPVMHASVVILPALAADNWLACQSFWPRQHKPSKGRRTVEAPDCGYWHT